MKLVDILARELKQWPESWKACAQESNGLVAGFSREDLVHGENNGWEGRIGPGSAYIPLSRGVISEQPIACDQRTAVITRAQWQAAVDALKADAAPAWLGVGLPPIGTVCEVVSPGYRNARFDRFVGQIVTVIAHDIIDSDPVAVFRVSVNGQVDEQEYHALVAKCFRPIRTPEQIAEELREKGILQMAHDCGDWWKA